MPVAGRKPKEGPKRNMMPAAHDWVEVVDEPFTGEPLVGLPANGRRVSTDDGDPVYEPLEALTLQWWETVSTMPHCRLWTRGDWQFAVATALVADAAFRGSATAAVELRQREKILGLTFDARRDLRIRYVRAIPTPTAAVVPSSVTSIEDRRKRSIDAP